VTKYTKKRRYPYPLRTERGAGALDIETLSRAFDRDAAALETSWNTDLQRPSATWTDTEAGISNGFDFEISTAGAWSEKVGAFDATWQKIAAYWLVSVNIGLTCTGTITGNTARIMKVQVNESQVGPFPLVRELYVAQDLQADGTVWVSTEFATLVDKGTTLTYLVNHANTGSTVNATLRSSVSLLVFA
jgi:hypothetical protein